MLSGEAKEAGPAGTGPMVVSEVDVDSAPADEGAELVFE
jgi:hypothetical protein